MSGPLYVISTGVRTPLGLNSASAAAAVRAAINSCGEHPFMIDQAGEPMSSSMDALLEPGVPCRERMLAMAIAALQEACQPLSGQSGVANIPTFLGFPEPRPGFGSEDAQWISKKLAQETAAPIVIDANRTCLSGHSAVLFLLDQVRQEMAQGQYPVCLVGGLESYFHPDTMEWLDENRQLLGTVSRSGFVPGEGAGFCLIMTQGAVQRAGLKPIAKVLNSAHGWETKLIKTQDINLGEALTQTVRKTVDKLDPAKDRIDTIYCDINGERYRAEEWGFACLKLAHYFADPTGYKSPADCWGDMGAASGALFVALATQAALRGYAPGRRSLLWSGSESGLRATALLDTEVIPNQYRG